MFLIAGPCVIEGRDHCISMANELQRMAARLDLRLIFKASFDKANRTSSRSFRGMGFEEGLDILIDISEFARVITDVHTPLQAIRCGRAGFVVQVPAMLSRQTDLLEACQSADVVNIKKSQTMSPADLKNAIQKIRPDKSDHPEIWITERGTQFGYNNLVVDFRNLVEMRTIGADKVVYDASHSVQRPGGHGDRSSGDSRYIAPLARAAVALGIDGLFIETHDDPTWAKCDGDIAYPLDRLEELLTELKEIDALSHRHPGTARVAEAAE